jgi:hypothetical protein
MLADLIPGIDPTLEVDLARVLDQITNGGKVTGVGMSGYCGEPPR